MLSKLLVLHADHPPNTPWDGSKSPTGSLFSCRRSTFLAALLLDQPLTTDTTVGTNIWSPGPTRNYLSWLTDLVSRKDLLLKTHERQDKSAITFSSHWLCQNWSGWLELYIFFLSDQCWNGSGRGRNVIARLLIVCFIFIGQCNSKRVVGFVVYFTRMS